MSPHSNSQQSPQELAEEVANTLGEMDTVSARLGIERLSIGPGYASMALEVDDRMVNGHQICHSGIICTLADITCAYAACSFNENNLAQSLNIQLLAPARIGMRLLAEAREVGVVGRTGVYDVEIRDEHSNQIALIRCQCRSIKGKINQNLPVGRGSA